MADSTSDTGSPSDPLPKPPSTDVQQSHAIRQSHQRYWRSNLKIMASLMAVWLFVGCGLSILLADVINPIKLPGTGFPLGFWFAQQGSIITFVLLILIYAILMNRLDKRHHDELQRIMREGR